MLPGFFHDTLGERDRAPALDLVRAVHPATQFDAPEPAPSTCSTPTAPATRATRRTALATPLAAAVAARPVLGAQPRLASASADWSREGIAHRHRHRLRFRLDARLRLRERRRAASARSAALIDRTFLDAIGWRGIRQRKLHLEELIGARDARG